MSVDHAEPTATEAASRATAGRWRRPLALAAVGAIVLAGAAWWATDRGDAPVRSEPRLDAWVPYWSVTDAAPGFAARAPQFREVSPFWFSVTTVDTVAADANVPPDASSRLLDAARAAGVALVPSVRDAMPAGAMAAALADPPTRRRHVEALVAFVQSGDYAGVDLDYEQFAFADDRSTWATTAASWIAFLTEVSQRLHADGRTLTVSVPPIYDEGRTSESGYWVYDYAAMAPVVDRIRIMTYDYATASPGPISPIDWVGRSIKAAAEVTGTPEKLVLGIPLYGYNWVTSTTGACPPDTESGRTTVTQRSLAELVAKRGATPVHDTVDDEWTFDYVLTATDGTTTCQQQRTVRYVDEAGARNRIALAESASFGGVSLWALGYEAESWWTPPAIESPSEGSGG